MFHNITHYKNILQRGKYGYPLIFFKTKKLLNVLRYQLKMFKSTVDKGLAFAKNIPALVKLWVINMDGKDC
jgi:hypothetical protein